MPNIQIPDKLEKIVKDIGIAGGKSYLVGGAVIDLIQKREIKDWDIEVYKTSLQSLESVLSRHGSANLVGKSFGIIKLRVDDIEYDFNIPRKENKIGIGHKDFNIELVPDISPKEAAIRRDLTINSMFYDLSQKILFDPFNGLDDLNNGIIRHTSSSFVEDPLRVLRIMQLLPRKAKKVAPETVELCKSLQDTYPSLANERVYEEWCKLLMKSEKPSIGLQFLVDCNWIKWYPELDDLRKTEQRPDWHPEGSVWNHTLMVVNNAAKLRKDIPDDWKESFMYGALLHDVGKAITTEEDLSAHGHAEEGVNLAKNFMKKLTTEKQLTDRVLKIVENHMRPGQLYRSKSGESAWKRLHNEIPLNILSYISKADSAGRTNRSLGDPHPTSELALEYFKKYGREKIPQILQGRDLIDRGYSPSPKFGNILRKAYQIQIDEGISDKNVLIERAVSQIS